MHAANVGASSNARQQAFRERVEALRRGRLSGEDSGIDRPFALIQVLFRRRLWDFFSRSLSSGCTTREFARPVQFRVHWV